MFSTLEEKLLVFLLSAVFLCCGILYERHKGAEACVAADTKAATKQELVVATQEAAAVPEIKKEIIDEKTAMAQPVAHPIVRLCPPSKPPNTSQVLPASTVTSGASSPPAVPAAPIEVDTGPINAVGRDADAQVNALLDFIHNVCHA